jgi:hypothetical protein
MRLAIRIVDLSLLKPSREVLRQHSLRNMGHPHNYVLDNRFATKPQQSLVFLFRLAFIFIFIFIFMFIFFFVFISHSFSYSSLPSYSVLHFPQHSSCLGWILTGIFFREGCTESVHLRESSQKFNERRYKSTCL